MCGSMARRARRRWQRFRRSEAAALRPLAGMPAVPCDARAAPAGRSPTAPSRSTANAYSVPWRLIGERVRVTIGGGLVRIAHAGREVAVHAELNAAARPRATDDPLTSRGRRASGSRCASPSPDPSARRSAEPRCCGRWRNTRRRSGEAADAADPDHLIAMLTRLKLTAMRDQLDSLLDEAARRELTIRDAWRCSASARSPARTSAGST